MRQPKPHPVTVTRYYGPDNKRCSATAPGARKVKEKSRTLYAKIPVDGVPTRVSLKTDDIGLAWKELHRLQRRERDRAAGIVDSFQEQGSEPLSVHLDAWIQALKAKGLGQEYTDALRANLDRLAGMARWKRVTDLTDTSLLTALAALQSEHGLSAQTRNHYTKRAKQFSRWCTRSRPRRLREDPFDGVGTVNVEVDRRHDRRAPTDAEVEKLFAYLHGLVDDGARWQKKKVRSRFVRTPYWRRGMSAPQRALGYQVSMATGFRADELRSLTPESFDLAKGTVTVQAAYSKHRRKDTQPLPGWLVEQLLAWFAQGGGCWERFPANYPGRLLKAELEGAGIPCQVGGLYFDFHSLRHWYCSQMANQPGISPKTLMQLCRHSTPSLTLKVYAKARDGELRAAVDQLPKLSPGELQ